MGGFTSQRRRSATKAELEQRSVEHFGPRLHELPWSGAAGARHALNPKQALRFEHALRRLDECWLEDPKVGVVDALRSVSRGNVILHGGARSRMPPWLLHDYQGRVSTAAQDLFGDTKVNMGAVRQYALEGHDAFAHRPVNLSTLMPRGHGMQALFDLLSFARLHQQLRVVFYEKERITGFAGMYMPDKEPSFTVEEHAALHALVPTLRRWLNTARALGTEPMEDHGLTTAIEANERPCYLVRADGVAVFANSAARALPFDREEFRAQFAGLKARSIRLPLAAETVHLIVRSPLQDDLAAKVEALPVSLRRIARSLARGLSDKEIALELDLPLSTVRTYTRRAFSRLGIGSRRDLIKLART